MGDFFSKNVATALHGAGCGGGMHVALLHRMR